MLAAHVAWPIAHEPAIATYAQRPSLYISIHVRMALSGMVLAPVNAWSNKVLVIPCNVIKAESGLHQGHAKRVVP